MADTSNAANVADPAASAASAAAAAVATTTSGPGSASGESATQDQVRLQVGQFLKAKQVETVREKKFSAEMTLLRQRMEVLEGDILQYMAMKGEEVLDTGRMLEETDAKGEAVQKYIRVKLAFKATAKQWTPNVCATMNGLLFGATSAEDDDDASDGKGAAGNSTAVEEAAALGFEGLTPTEARVVCAYQWYMSLREGSDEKKGSRRGRSIVVGPPTRANLLFALFDSIRRGDLASKATHLVEAPKRVTKAEAKRRAKEAAARREQAIKAAAAQGTVPPATKPDVSGGGDDGDEAAATAKRKAYDWFMDGRRLKALRAISKGKKKKTARLMEKQKAFIMRHLEEKGADRIPVNVRAGDSQKKVPYNIQVVTHTKKKSIPAKVASQIFRDRLGTVFESSAPTSGSTTTENGNASNAALDTEVKSAVEFLTWFQTHRDLVAAVGTTFNEDLVQWQADNATVIRDVDLRPQTKKVGSRAGKKDNSSTATEKERMSRKRAADAEERKVKRQRRQAFIEDLPDDIDPSTVGHNFF